MPPKYTIHPGIGIARLGDSPDGFYISPEKPAQLPIACDAQGNPLLSPDGTTEVPVTRFKDAKGRVKRQAARFQVHVYDEESPEGRPLKLGDPIKGGGNEGVLVDIQWRVWVANKKAVWYEFDQLQGEHGYGPRHPRRNPGIQDVEARQQLIIDPGPQLVNGTDRRRASMGRDRDDLYAPVFPPQDLSPRSVDTLGDLLTDDTGRLLVLGGHGRSGTMRSGFGHPRIDHYANNDGWFDDTSDGPVMARLVMYAENVDRLRYIDVEYPAWVVVGYPRYVPEMLDMVTTDDVIYDMAIREFAYRTDLYGLPGTFDAPECIAPTDTAALLHWKAGALEWNRRHKPWFWRDVWPILFRANEFSGLSNILQQSNFPHDQTPRGNFDPERLGRPPFVHRLALERLERKQVEQNHGGDLYLEAVDLILAAVQSRAGPAVRPAGAPTAGSGEVEPEGPARWAGHFLAALLREERVGEEGTVEDAVREAVSAFVGAVPALGAAFEAYEVSASDPEAAHRYQEAWRRAYESGRDEYAAAQSRLEDRLLAVFERLEAGVRARTREVLGRPADGEPGPGERSLLETLRMRGEKALDDYLTGKLLAGALDRSHAECTQDPYRGYRAFLFQLLRRPGEENELRRGGKPGTPVYRLPLMPLLAGDNPISNVIPSKFLRLTDYQLFVLAQWAQGLFFNEVDEGWREQADPWKPYDEWENATAAELDRGVLSNLLGGAFCPGGEVGWIQRNPSAFLEPYRIKASPDFYVFRQTAGQANAQANAPQGIAVVEDYVATGGLQLSQDGDLRTGLEPGDLTKYMALPWQADFNECSTQDIDVTFEGWNQTFADSTGDPRLALEEQMWETLWWPAHRPLQAYEVVSFADGAPAFQFMNWARGVPDTNAGDLKMVTEWSRLGFVVRNPHATPDQLDQASPPVPKYVSVERTPDEERG